VGRRTSTSCASASSFRRRQAARRPEVPLAGALHDHLDDASARSKTTARSCSSTPSTRARASRSRACSPIARLSGEAAAILESHLRVAGDWDKLIGALEILAKSERRRRAQGRAAAQDRRDRGDSARSARSRHRLRSRAP
jgi:hypothetical protein